MKTKGKHTLYVIGGASRVGKSTIAGKFLKRKHPVVISTDGMREALRNAIIGESHVSIEKIAFSGHATFRRPGSLKLHKIKFSRRNKGEDELAWLGVQGLIKAYDRKNAVDVLVEGIALTPASVNKMKLKNLKVRAVFIGYSKPTHALAILAHSKKKKDWVHTWIKEHGGNETIVHDWVRKGIRENKALEAAAKKFGYGYFDITERPFKMHIAAIVNYLLK